MIRKLISFPITPKTIFLFRKNYFMTIIIMVNHTLNFIEKKYTHIIDTINTLDVQINTLINLIKKTFNLNDLN